MKRIILFLLLIATVNAASYTDTLDADFSTGNTSEVNVTSDSIILPLITATEYNSSGTFYSQVFDLGSNPTAVISWSYSTPSSTALLVSTRSGNNSTSFSGWSSWSSSYSTSTGSTVTSPTERYYQYRTQLTTTANTSTPTVTDVTLNYTEGNISITAVSTLNTNITRSSTGAIQYYINITDTYEIVTAYAIYNYSNGETSSFTNLTPYSLNTYYLNLSRPSGNWTNLSSGSSDGLIDIAVYVNVTNGSTILEKSSTIQEVVEFVNTVPVVDTISDQIVQQNATMNITVTATDADGQNLSFSASESAITVTSLTNTTARLIWIPNATNVGLNTIIVYAFDGYGNSSESFVVNVTDVNDAPSIDEVEEITGYHGVRQTITLTGYDFDSDASISFTMDPDFTSFTTTTNVGNGTTSGTYYGVSNFTPANEEHGTQNVTFYISDGYNTSNTTTTMTIDYCGDETCQETYENETSCEIDCVTVTELDRISLIVPDRNCANTSMTIFTYNATNRFSCYYQGLIEEGLALCEGLDSVSVQVYKRSGSLLIDKGSLSSSANGTATFTPDSEGEYKFVATKEGYANTSSNVYVRTCSANIVVQTQNTTIQQPVSAEEDEEETERVQEEKPAPVEQTTSIISVILFYFIVPTLLAMLVYASFVFYDVNKDTLPWILEMRIFMYEKRVQYQPQIAALNKKISPVTKPVIQSLKALSDSTIKPLIDRLKNIGKKPKL